MSKLVEKLLGTELDPPVLEASEAWVADKLRAEPAVQAFCRVQPEKLKLHTLKIEGLDDRRLTFSLQGHAGDHESTHLFEVEVRAVFDTADKTIERL